MPCTAKVREHFWAKVNKNGPTHPICGQCWQWTGNTLGRLGNEYGSILVFGKIVKAHRLSWRIRFGNFPEELNVLHKCDNRLCVNPAHLFLGTYADNNKDCRDKGRFVSCKGERNGNSKVDEDTVRWIRRTYCRYSGRRSNIRHIMQVTGLSQCMVLFIVKRQNWKHVE